ncbi:histone-lysine N-methyltransferase SETMAR [Trichonephila clavipes]|nr:histone-lysine N-methyltransferase SETMAR [Trichonephila clavipes]
MATLPDCPVRWLTYGNPKTVRKLGEQGNKAVLGWVIKEGLIPSRYECQKCKKGMLLVERKGTIDGFEWRCRVQSKENPHFVCRSRLPDNTTIHSEVCCHQLNKLNDALQQKRSELINRKGVVFHQDNTRPYTSLVTCQKLLQLEWDTMPHPPYSPDLAPSDYYLFRSLQNFLDGKTFTSK